MPDTPIPARTSLARPVPGWTDRAPPARTSFTGTWCHVRPLDVAADGAALWQAFRGADQVWDYMAAGPFATEAGFLDWLTGRQASADPLFFTVADKADDRPLGIFALMETRPSNGVTEIGNIAFSPALQRTRIATEAVYLMAGHVFDDLGYRRFEWKCNHLNEPSKRAALRFGFRPEGLFRQHMVVKGRNRDTAWFSIIDSEWPDCRQAFQNWLAPDNFDAAGRQKKTLSAFRARS